MKVGSRVVHLDEPQVMTVESIDHGLVVCTWLDMLGLVRRGQFYYHNLKVVK